MPYKCSGAFNEKEEQMKKFSLLFLIGALLSFSLVGCNKTKEPDYLQGLPEDFIKEMEAAEEKAAKIREEGESIPTTVEDTTEKKDDVPEVTEDAEEKTPESASDYIRIVMADYVDKYFDGDAEKAYLYGLNYVLINSREAAEDSVDKQDLDWYYQKFGFEGYLDYVEYAYTTAGLDYSKVKEMYETSYDLVRYAENPKSGAYLLMINAPAGAITPLYGNFDTVYDRKIEWSAKEYLAEYRIDEALDMIDSDNPHDYKSTTTPDEFFGSNNMMECCAKLYAKKDELFEKCENGERMDAEMKYEDKFRLFDPDKYNK